MLNNAAQVHLLLNHLPVTGSLVACLVLLSGMILKNASVRKTGLSLLVFAALTSIPAFLSGEPAEEMMEERPGVSESIMHDHEEAAEAALVMALVNGGIAAAGLLLTRRTGAPDSWVRNLKGASLFLGLLTVGAMGRAAHLGGLIKHDELREDASAASTSKEAKESEKNHHD